jgi:hypothetical protein
VHALPRQQQRPHEVRADREGHDDADGGDRECAPADASQLLEAGLQADLEEQHDHAELREKLQYAVLAHRLEERKTNEHEVAEHHAHHQFAEHGRLADAFGEAGELRSEQDDGDPEKFGWHGVGSTRFGGERSERPLCAGQQQRRRDSECTHPAGTAEAPRQEVRSSAIHAT